jgi:hypothetical protein
MIEPAQQKHKSATWSSPKSYARKSILDTIIAVITDESEQGKELQPVSC